MLTGYNEVKLEVWDKDIWYDKLSIQPESLSSPWNYIFLVYIACRTGGVPLTCGSNGSHQGFKFGLQGHSPKTIHTHPTIYCICDISMGQTEMWLPMHNQEPCIRLLIMHAVGLMGG